MESIISFFRYIWNNFFVLIFSSNNLLFDVIDILVVTYIVYKIIQFMRQTRAEQLIKGIVIFVIAYFVAQLLNLNALSWIISTVSVNFLVVIVILFQPELRSILERLGRGGFTNFSLTKNTETDKETLDMIDTLCNAVEMMHRTKTGALIVVERQTMLSEVALSGTIIDASVSTNLINNIFFKNSPLHDGAMIIRDNRIYAASCILPLTQNFEVDSALGTRHRAAIGVSEISDALVIVVSEENGKISMANNSKIVRNYTKDTLKEELEKQLVEPVNDKNQRKMNWFFKKKVDKNDEE